MNRTIETLFDGLVFRPLEPVDLAPNTRVRIAFSASTPTVESMAASLMPSGPEHAREPESPGESEQDLEQYIYDHYVYSDFNRRPRD